jgi:hypothetical protein
MKYFKIIGNLVMATDELTKDDLVRVKNRTYDLLINKIEETYYDAEDNEWKPIEKV